MEFVGVSGVYIRGDVGFRLPHCSSKVTLIPRDAQEKSLQRSLEDENEREMCEEKPPG